MPSRLNFDRLTQPEVEGDSHPSGRRSPRSPHPSSPDYAGQQDYVADRVGVSWCTYEEECEAFAELQQMAAIALPKLDLVTSEDAPFMMKVTSPPPPPPSPPQPPPQNAPLFVFSTLCGVVKPAARKRLATECDVASVIRTPP